MSEALRFVPPRVQLVDPRTGMISREWYLFFQGLFNRVGGADGAGTVDLEASLFEDAGSSETNSMVFALEQATSQLPPYSEAVCAEDTPPAYQQPTTVDNISAELSALQDRVSELVKELDSIKQGILI